MTIEVKHTTQAAGTDAGNGEIRKAQWNESHTINMATAKLLGRSTAGTGAAEEISIGSGLSLTSGTLSASGGGATLTISNKTGAYTVVAGDLGTIINCTSGTFTVSLTAAASLGSGFNCTIWNTSDTATDAITIDPAGTETLDGRTTRILRRGEGMQIVCNGTNWQTGNKKTMRGYAENFATSQAIPIATGAGSVAISNSAEATGAGSIGIGGKANADATTAIGYNSAYGLAQASTGLGSMALGGSYASGTDSLAAAVANNTSTYGAKGTNSIALGYQSRAEFRGIAIGYEATASGGTSAIAIGRTCTASGEYTYAFGMEAVNSTKGKFAFASFGSTGAYQFGLIVLRGSTTNDTARQLNFEGTTSYANAQVTLPNNSAYAFSGIIVARRQAAGGTESAAWKVEGLIRREANAASTTLVASTVTAISNVPGWTLALSADTTNGGLAVTATGAVATNIRWVATIQTSEVTYA
jgi:hypothetical protein